MSWKSFYHPTQENIWQGRTDVPDKSLFYQIVQSLNLADVQAVPTPRSFALLGFCCDEGVRRNFGRPGAKEGPNAIRQALAKLPVPEASIPKCFDAGNIVCDQGDLEGAQQALGEAVKQLLLDGMTPIVLGGGHEMAWGHFQGIESYLEGSKSLGILNFDAHFDMRPLTLEGAGSSGTPFLQIAEACEKNERRFHYTCLGIQPHGNIPLLFENADRHHVHFLTAQDLEAAPEEAAQLIETRVLANNEALYVSICLDVFSAAIAPGVSAPQVLGVAPQKMIPLLRQLAESGMVLSYDLAELCPALDRDQQTAKLAANLVLEILNSHSFS